DRVRRGAAAGGAGGVGNALGGSTGGLLHGRRPALRLGARGAVRCPAAAAPLLLRPAPPRRSRRVPALGRAPGPARYRSAVHRRKRGGDALEPARLGCPAGGVALAVAGGARAALVASAAFAGVSRQRRGPSALPTRVAPADGAGPHLGPGRRRG